MSTVGFFYMPVPELAPALAFYRDTLGWTEGWREGDHTVTLEMPGVTAQLTSSSGIRYRIISGSSLRWSWPLTAFASLPGERLKSYYMRNFVGLPFETTMAGAALVFGGVIERHPDIAFCLCHGGGFVPYQAGRFLHAYEVRAEPKVRLRGSPEDSMARLHHDSIVHSARALAFLIDTVGAEHVLLGSDYPFDMGNLDCVARVEALDIPAKDRDLILGGYAGGVLGVSG